MSLTGIPRPLKFNSLNQFVLGNSQNFSQSYQAKSHKSGVFVIKNTEQLFDRYNVNNLLLEKVNKNHLQVLNKNIILNEEDIDPNKIFAQTGFKGTVTQNLKQTSKQNTQNMTKLNNFMQTNVTGVNNNNIHSETSFSNKPIAKTSQGFYISAQKPSKQCSQNDLLFNFNKMAEQKKAKKKQFLQTIEAKIGQIQLQAKQLQDCQFQQAIQLQQIERIQGELGRELTSNSFKGRVTQKIYQNFQHQQDQEDQQLKQPKSLHLNMSPVEINHVLNSHYEENQRLLDQILRVKSRSKQKYFTQEQSTSQAKQFTRTGLTTNYNFNKTSTTQGQKTFLPNSTQKKILSIATKVPPKHAKR